MCLGSGGLLPGPNAIARYAGLRGRLRCTPWATRYRPLRGLAGSRALRTQGSRTRPRLHALARFAGLRVACVAHPGLADSPKATRNRPLRGRAAARLDDSKYAAEHPFPDHEEFIFEVSQPPRLML
jgi:hypothetical protein